MAEKLRPRPDWCKQAECSLYEMGEFCVLQDWLISGTFSMKEREPTYKMYRNMVINDPEKLRQRCRGKFTRI